MLVTLIAKQLEFRKAIQSVKRKIGNSIITEAELSNAFLGDVILPFLRQKIGVLADIKLERRIKKRRYDTRIGSLIVGFENPAEGLDKGIEQAGQYIEEFRNKGQKVTCLVLNGKVAVFVDEHGSHGDIIDIESMVTELEGELSLLALQPV
jgi:hypothetical protein